MRSTFAVGGLHPRPTTTNPAGTTPSKSPTLQGIAASVRIVELPGLPAKGDVSDWMAAGGTREK